MVIRVNYCGSTPGVLREYSGSTPGVLREYSGRPPGVPRESYGSPTGVTRESQGSPTGVLLDPCKLRLHPLRCKTQQKLRQPPYWCSNEYHWRNMDPRQEHLKNSPKRKTNRRFPQDGSELSHLDMWMRHHGLTIVRDSSRTMFSKYLPQLLNYRRFY